MPETKPKPHKPHTDIADKYACDICTPPRRFAARAAPRPARGLHATFFALSGPFPRDLYDKTALSIYAVGRYKEHAELWDEIQEALRISPHIVLGPPNLASGMLQYSILNGWNGRVIDQSLIDDVHDWMKTSPYPEEMHQQLRTLLPLHRGARAVVIDHDGSLNNLLDQIENDG